MTEEQRKLCSALVIAPIGKRRISKEDFVRQFPSALEDGKLAQRWLDGAETARSDGDLSSALLIGIVFGFASSNKDVLCRLVDVDWHCSHEDIVSVLQTWPTVDTVEALFHATQWIPTSLEYDDCRALAVKAIWALGKVPGPEAEAKLKTLAHSEDPILRKNAMEQLERRRKAR